MYLKQKLILLFLLYLMFYCLCKAPIIQLFSCKLCKSAISWHTRYCDIFKIAAVLSIALHSSGNLYYLYLYLYIYKRKFARLSLTLSVTPITRLQLPTSTLQPSNAINLLYVNVKFITSSSRGVQFALCSRLKKKTLSNIPLKPQQHLWPSW